MSDKFSEEYNQKQVEKAEFESGMYNSTLRALQTEERFVNFFKNYNPQSVEQFCKSYAQRKTQWYAYADTTSRYLERKKTKWRTEAVEWLREIMYKKIFNLMCRWVAGEMDLPGIETHHDFQLWKNNDALQKAAGYITRDEVECYLDFRALRWEAISAAPTRDEKWNRINEFDDPSITIVLDSYHWYRSMSLEGQDKMPPWFQHYDRHFGTGNLPDLPGTRCDLEMDYFDIWVENIQVKTLTEEQLKNRQHLNRKQRLELKNDPVKRQAYRDEQSRKWKEQEATRPKYIHLGIYNQPQMKALVEMIEPAEVRDLYSAYREWKNRGQWAEQIEMAIIDLKDEEELVSVESHEDYRESIRNAYEQLEETRAGQVIWPLFDEYTETIANGQAFNWQTNPYESRGSVSELKRYILEARKFNGDPENFDFLKKENLPESL